MSVDCDPRVIITLPRLNKAGYTTCKIAYNILKKRAQVVDFFAFDTDDIESAIDRAIFLQNTKVDVETMQAMIEKLWKRTAKDRRTNTTSKEKIFTRISDKVVSELIVVTDGDYNLFCDAIVPHIQRGFCCSLEQIEGYNVDEVEYAIERKTGIRISNVTFIDSSD